MKYRCYAMVDQVHFRVLIARLKKHYFIQWLEYIALGGLE